MSLTIQLLGRPRIVRASGEAYQFRSRKSWALLAYLILSERPPTRSQLASLLFAEADDPVRALRWNLSEIRRGLGEDGSVDGDPVILQLPAGALVDVEVVIRGAWADAVRLPGLGADLLEGMTVRGAAAFETWLLSEQRHVAAASEAILHEAAVGQSAGPVRYPFLALCFSPGGVELLDADIDGEIENLTINGAWRQPSAHDPVHVRVAGDGTPARAQAAPRPSAAPAPFATVRQTRRAPAAPCRSGPAWPDSADPQHLGPLRPAERLDRLDARAGQQRRDRAERIPREPPSSAHSRPEITVGLGPATAHAHMPRGGRGTCRDWSRSVGFSPARRSRALR